MADDWSDLPMLLTVEEAGRLLRVGRSHAYNQVTLYFASGGTDCVPALRLGGWLRVPSTITSLVAAPSGPVGNPKRECEALGAPLADEPIP